MNPQISKFKYQISIPKELYIVGPTASGKSALSMLLAAEISSEIVCADSQTIRKRLDIGTAKPSQHDRKRVPHHMIDIVEPFDDYSVTQFQKDARSIIEGIKKRGALPIIVGGSGLYVDSLLFDYTLSSHTNASEKKILEQCSTAQLRQIIKDNNYPMPENSNNPRHLIGVILRKGKNADDRSKLRKNSIVMGILPKDEELKKRIDLRVEDMFSNGFVEEVESLLEMYGSFPDKLDAIGYPIVESYITGKCSLSEAKDMFKRADWQYARRQKAWFKRNPHITWYEDVKTAHQALANLLKHHVY